MMFNPEKFVNEKIPEIKKMVEGKAIIAASGGVDSTVAAAIVTNALGENLVSVFVDTGYMRKNEPETAKKMLRKLGLKSQVC